MMEAILAIAGCQHRRLHDHLIAADGHEAAAILLCGRSGNDRLRLIVRDMILVPYDVCAVRRPDFINWPGALVSEALSRAEDENLSIILAHSHPGGLFEFSGTDDDSDAVLITALQDGWCGAAPSPSHGSAIMVPGGAIRARIYVQGALHDCRFVEAVGDDFRRWYPSGVADPIMAFGDAMTAELGRRHACVVGVSGTGSIVAEQLARLGIGGLTLVDFDHVEHKNLNRILNSTRNDADLRRPKVDMFADVVKSYRPDIRLRLVRDNLLSREAVLAAAECDMIFSCVDSSEGRQLADLIAQAMCLPVIDMGVTIPTRLDAQGNLLIAEAIGRLDVIQPGGSTLADRDVYGPESLRAEYLARVAPDTFAAERDAGYIKGAPQEAPAVIALNMRAASAAVLEYIARAFPFRHEPNRHFARTIFRLGEGSEERESEDVFESCESGILGMGAHEPLLGLPALGGQK